ncbi:MAG TPA: hypothetical protein ENL16_00860 [Candidatus Woesearchaeota archaeon]|nr:hypothetical protein [Candidatus Woesearchaeota archaeon]
MKSKNKTSRTPFEVKWHHRHDLRKWLEENFPFLREKSFLNYSSEDYALLEERAEEIVNACALVERIDIRARSDYVDYYADDWKKIKKAYADKDYRALGDALAELLISIDCQ